MKQYLKGDIFEPIILMIYFIGYCSFNITKETVITMAEKAFVTNNCVDNTGGDHVIWGRNIPTPVYCCLLHPLHRTEFLIMLVPTTA